jgi:chromatin segregation and condensation protein Rec8/ScpA/Scc1 (kleisin family)
MRATTARPSARLLSIRQAEAEYGIPYAQLLDLAKRGEVAAVQPPNIRRIYVVRADLERKLETWRIA